MFGLYERVSDTPRGEGTLARQRWIWFLGSVSALAVLPDFFAAQQDGRLPRVETDQFPVEHPECSFFGPQRELFVTDALERVGGRRASTRSLSAITDQVMRAMAVSPDASPIDPHRRAHAGGTLDSYIFADFEKHGITPAPPSTDWEFIRRVTLDITGRIPTSDRVAHFRGR